MAENTNENEREDLANLLEFLRGVREVAAKNAELIKRLKEAENEFTETARVGVFVWDYKERRYKARVWENLIIGIDEKKLDKAIDRLLGANKATTEKAAA